MGSKFDFGGQTWVLVSSKFNLLSSKWFKVHFIFGFDLTLISAIDTGDKIGQDKTDDEIRQKRRCGLPPSHLR